jgi:hypothetical protein
LLSRVYSSDVEARRGSTRGWYTLKYIEKGADLILDVEWVVFDEVGSTIIYRKGS